MMKICISLGATLLLSLLSVTSGDVMRELVLDERVLGMSLVAARLSALAYTANTTEYATSFDGEGNANGFAHPEYEEIRFYQDEPDQAILAKKEGRCYLAFRGTIPELDDWLQNFNLNSFTICKDNNDPTTSSTECCETRAGYAEFLARDPVQQAYSDLILCLDSVCTEETMEDCLVITGHSQGGAVATVASVALHSRLPTVITFGQPPAMDAGCDLIPSDRFYRYVNSMQDIGQTDDMGFDLIAYSPNWWSSSVHYGYYILVGEDPNAVKYLGFDNTYDFIPSVADGQPKAHSISTQPYSYETRLVNLVSSLPNVKTDGFSEGFICEGGSYEQLCESGLCFNYQCLPMGGVVELCAPETCVNDAHCAGDNACIYGACATASGEVTGTCPCRWSSQCISQDCNWGFTCEIGANEDVTANTGMENATGTTKTVGDTGTLGDTNSGAMTASCALIAGLNLLCVLVAFMMF